MVKGNKMSLDIVVDNIDGVISEKNELVERAMIECGLDMERFAKEELYPNHGKVTGRLQNSITFATSSFHSSGNDRDGAKASTEDMALRGTPESATVYVGTNVVYAPYVELGSSKRKGGGYHFLKNSLQNHLSDYETIIKNILSD